MELTENPPLVKGVFLWEKDKSVTQKSLKQEILKEKELTELERLQ